MLNATEDNLIIYISATFMFTMYLPPLVRHKDCIASLPCLLMLLLYLKIKKII